MAAPPASNTISMVVQEWQGHHNEQFSAVHRINGFPWRLRLYPGVYGGPICFFSLVCDKSSESELWQCTADILATIATERPFTMERTHTFNSWDRTSQNINITRGEYPASTVLTVEFKTISDGESWRRRPILDPLDPRDGILVVEEKKIYVHKQVLAAQSPFFDKLFNSDFKEKNMAEIPIGDVTYEELCNIIWMVYGSDLSELNDENIHRVLQLADRFELKIVEDRVVSHLLSSSTFSSLSTAQKILLSDKYNLQFLKDRLLSKNYTSAEHKALTMSDELEQLSIETLRILYKKSSNLLP